MSKSRLRDPDTGRFIPDAYAGLIRQAVPAYDRFQERIGEVAGAVKPVSRVLDLGLGTGETSARVLDQHPGALVTGVEESPEMAEFARERLGEAIAHIEVESFGVWLPDGPFDLVVSALAVHHLTHEAKRALYRDLYALLRPGGRFVQGDLRTDGPDVGDRVIGDPTNDIPAAGRDMVDWLVDAGFAAELDWELGDLCIIVADRPA